MLSFQLEPKYKVFAHSLKMKKNGKKMESAFPRKWIVAFFFVFMCSRAGSHQLIELGPGQFVGLFWQDACRRENRVVFVACFIARLWRRHRQRQSWESRPRVFSNSMPNLEISVRSFGRNSNPSFGILSRICFEFKSLLMGS